MSKLTNTSQDIFASTMHGLEQALTVRHIATFEVIASDPDENAAALFARYPDYDQFPVKKGDSVIGVVERPKNIGDETIRAHMKPLADSLLIAAEQPLAQFLPLMVHEPYYRLVLRGQSINGIVTRSDLLKLPVRLLAFARVTHLELVLANLIDKYFDDENQWLQALSSKRRKNVENKKKRFQSDRANPPLLELTELIDKRDIMAHICRPDPDFVDFVNDMNEVIKLRHKVAHAGDFAQDIESLEEFLKQLKLADDWISKLTQMLDD